MNGKYEQVTDFADMKKWNMTIEWISYVGNQKLEIWKRTDGTVVGRSLDDGQSTNEYSDFDGSVSQQEVSGRYI